MDPTNMQQLPPLAPPEPLLPSVQQVPMHQAPAGTADDGQSAPVPAASAQQSHGQVVDANAIDAPTAAEDQDLIEREWVTRAKQIIQKNRFDPYKQSQELTIFKAEYMQKRYNKQIKVSD